MQELGERKGLTWKRWSALGARRRTCAARRRTSPARPPGARAAAAGSLGCATPARRSACARARRARTAPPPARVRIQGILKFEGIFHTFGAEASVRASIAHTGQAHQRLLIIYTGLIRPCCSPVSAAAPHPGAMLWTAGLSSRRLSALVGVPKWAHAARPCITPEHERATVVHGRAQHNSCPSMLRFRCMVCLHGPTSDPTPRLASCCPRCMARMRTQALSKPYPSGRTSCDSKRACSAARRWSTSSVDILTHQSVTM